jgi:hypothetical protein
MADAARWDDGGQLTSDLYVIWGEARGAEVGAERPESGSGVFSEGC